VIPAAVSNDRLAPKAAVRYNFRVAGKQTSAPCSDTAHAAGRF
jgi:hypothetical protein